MKWFFFLIPALFLLNKPLHAQITEGDTVINSHGTIVTGNNVVPEPRPSSRYDDSVRHKRIKRTTIRSALIPGWGQISNRQAWKVPLVVAAISLPAVLFFNNLKEYRALRQSYIYRLDKDTSNDILVPERFRVLSNNSIKFYRDSYRQNVDYSALVFILAWGLNVVDAAVFANLKDFDVSEKLGLQIKPAINFMGRSSVGLVLTFRDAKKSKPFFTN